MITANHFFGHNGNTGAALFLLPPIVVYLLLQLYRTYLSKTITVQCWFCMGRLRIPRSEENAFVCDKCDQYNGFTEDGDYNRVIPEQHLECSTKHFRPFKESFASKSDVLCCSCQLKQKHLIKKLSDFEPRRKDQWSRELKEYTAYLEQLYPLCEECHERSKAVISEMDSKVLPSFLTWKRTAHRPYSEATVVTRCKASSDFGYDIPRPLYLLARFCGFICLLILSLEFFLSAVVQFYCLASIFNKNSVAFKLLKHAPVKHLRPQILPHCSYFLHLADLTHTPPLVRLWFRLLVFLLQLIFIFFQFSSHIKERKHRSAYPNPILFLLDAFILIAVGHCLIIDISSLFSESSAPKLPLLHVLLVLGFIFVPIIISVCLAVARWIRFCSDDWKSQKQLLREYWPRYDPTNSSVSVISDSTDRTPLSPTSDYSPIPEFESNWGMNPTKPLFRSPILSWPPSSQIGCPTTVAHSFTGLKQSPLNTSDESHSIAPSGMTSVSRRRSYSRHKRRHRRTGLLRFLLSLLFGRIETLSDVLKELICLANAVLVAMLIFATIRIFFRFLELL